MPRSQGLGVHFTLSDCGGRFTVTDYCYPMVMGCASLLEAPFGQTGFSVDYAGLMADNLRASFHPDLVAGTSLGLLFPLLIHLSEINVGPVLADQLPPAPAPPSPYVPAPYPATAPVPSRGAAVRAPDDSPWSQRPLDRYPCPRPLGIGARRTSLSGPAPSRDSAALPGFEWSEDEAETTSHTEAAPQNISQKCRWSPEVLVARAGDGINRIRQKGGAGGDRLIASAGSGENQVIQRGGWGAEKMVATLGHGHNEVEQSGGPGDDDQRARLGHGNNSVRQSGGWGDDRQIVVAGDGNNRIIQDGGRGDDFQRVVAGRGNNLIKQAGGAGDDEQHVTVRGGHNVIRQDGGSGDDIQCVRVLGDGNNSIDLDGGSGNDVQEVIVRGAGQNHIRVDGGSGDDVIRVRGGSGDDTIIIQGGPGDDQIFYTVSPGNDVVDIDGGGQWFSHDVATIHVGRENVTILDEKGNVLFSQGSGGSRITVRNIHELTVLDANGRSLPLR